MELSRPGSLGGGRRPEADKRKPGKGLWQRSPLPQASLSLPGPEYAGHPRAG